MWSIYVHQETGNACLSRDTFDMATGNIKREDLWFNPTQQASKQFKDFCKKWVK